MSFWVVLGYAAPILAFYLTLGWLVSVRLHDASIVDVMWGPGFALVAAVGAWGGAGDPVEGVPTYQSPGRDQSPLEQYLRGPKAPPATPTTFSACPATPPRIRPRGPGATSSATPTPMSSSPAASRPSRCSWPTAACS